MNILKGRLNRKDMSRFVGVESRELDKSLALFKEKGYITYEKIQGKYHFVLFGEPIEKEMVINNEPG